MILHLVLVLCSFLYSTQIVEGNIGEFDCVNIYKQPAFQHPRLKTHKIQTKFSAGESAHLNKYITNDESCPKGTVPVPRQRNMTEEVLHPNQIGYSGHHFAVYETCMLTRFDKTIYRGAEAHISVHNLTLRRNQLSRSQIWLENGPPGELNSIQVGWSVHPRLYGDSATRFTIHWTSDGYKKFGCYNTMCPGFVLVTRNPSVGCKFSKSSVYGGKTVFQFSPKIFQDRHTGSWVLQVGHEIIGYWPKEIFTHLQKGASLLRFGGNTYISPDGISPPMGNGHFPVADFWKSASFMHVAYLNYLYNKFDFNQGRRIKSYADSECFKLWPHTYTKAHGVSFSFGGPGGECGL